MAGIKEERVVKGSRDLKENKDQIDTFGFGRGEIIAVLSGYKCDT